MADKRLAVVTGGMGGLGESISTKMADAGYRVVVTYSPSNTKFKAWLDEMKGKGYSFAAFPVDVASYDDCAAIAARIQKECGQIDILVNNAGIQFVSPVEEFPAAKWDAILAINLSSNFHAIAAALPGMRARGFGRIVNVASAHGLVASPFKTAYVAAKHGVVGLTKSVALEVAQADITCNAICPGFVRTPLAEAQVPPLAQKHGVSEEAALRDHLLAKQPSKRWIEPAEVARMALWLVGPDSGGVNGAALSIDGGWLAA